MNGSIVIPRVFCGPPDSGNGGYSAGRLAAFIDGPAEVTLRRPPPLDRALRVMRRDDDVVAMLDGDEVVAEAVATTVEGEVPPPVTIAQANEATERCPFLLHPSWHPFPSCFVCGPDRSPGEGMRLFAGPVPERDDYATSWVPAPQFCDDDGLVAPEFVWAALDCPSSAGIYATGEQPDAPFVLGRLAVRIDERPPANEPLVAHAWRVGLEGRKLFAGSALRNESGQVFAVARATWIRI
jgi:hypothetical protein